MNSIESDDAFGTILVRVVKAPLLVLVGWIKILINFFRGSLGLGLQPDFWHLSSAN
jgi:hypothetical protein